MDPVESSVEEIGLEEALARFRKEARKGTCKTSRSRLPFFTWGEGPPLLFIHGVSDNAASFIPVISRLSRKFCCIAYTQAGMPGDQANFDWYQHEDLVADALAILDNLKVDSTFVFGSSFGSTVTIQAMRKHPERFQKAVLQGGLCYRPLSRREHLIASIARWVPGRMKNMPMRVKIGKALNGSFFKRRPPSTWDYFIETTGKTPIRTFAQQVLILNRLDLRPVLPEVRQPVLLLCGEKDVVTGPRHAKMLHDGLPSAVIATIPGCGHTPSYTHPEILVEAVSRFLLSDRPVEKIRRQDSSPAIHPEGRL